MGNNSEVNGNTHSHFRAQPGLSLCREGHWSGISCERIGSLPAVPGSHLPGLYFHRAGLCLYHLSPQEIWEQGTTMQRWGWQWQRMVLSQDLLLQFQLHIPGSPAAVSGLIFAFSDNEVQLYQGPCHQLGLFSIQHRSLCMQSGACLLPRSCVPLCGMWDVGLFRKKWSYPPSPGYYTKL